MLISHSFSTIAIGGFSTHDASIGHFQSPLINAMTTFFMFFAGINFALHFFAWRKKTVSHYFGDSEVKGYVLVSVYGCFDHRIYPVPVQYLWILDIVRVRSCLKWFPLPQQPVIQPPAFSVWPTFLPLLLFITSFVGGCSGSTAGGMKVVRIMLIFKQGVRELHRLVHPNAILTIKLGGQPVHSRVGEAVWGFFATYVFLLVVMFLLVDGNRSGYRNRLYNRGFLSE